jgi:hypothetical protein
MTILQMYRVNSASQEPKPGLRGLMQRLGLTFLACTLAVGATEAQQVAPPIAGLLGKSSHLQAAQSTFRHLQAWFRLMSSSPSQPISRCRRI